MIAIPNMEKPTNCIDCIAHRSYDHDEYFWYGSNYCKALGKYFNKDKLDIDPFKQILPDCPLIEIPDEIWEALKPKVDTMSMALKGWVEDVLKNKNGFGVDN